jgi:hypothetical protein
MKKYYTLLTLTILSYLPFAAKSYAQITITDADMPSIGTTFVTAYDTTSSVLNTLTPGSAGASVTWNFGSLTTSYTTTDILVAPKNTPYAASFKNANLADSVVGTVGYNYISSTVDSFNIVGSEQLVKGVMIAAALNPPITELKFPAQYGEITGGKTMSKVPPVVFTGLGSSYDSAKGIIHISYADTIDAWGSITTPLLGGTTYSTLRQKHYQLTIDSVFVHATGGSWTNLALANQTTKSYTYRWYTNGLGDLVATMTMDTATKTKPTSVAWYDGLPSGINEVSETHNTIVYPNPATTQISFHYNAQNAQSIFVYDITGRSLNSIDMKNGIATLNTSSFSSGIYFYDVTDRSGNLLDCGKFSIVK